MTLCDWYNDVMNWMDVVGNKLTDDDSHRRENVKEINILLIPIHIVGYFILASILVLIILGGRWILKFSTSKESDAHREKYFQRRVDYDL